jgi:hypothetical protein
VAPSKNHPVAGESNFPGNTESILQSYFFILNSNFFFILFDFQNVELIQFYSILITLLLI